MQLVGSGEVLVENAAFNVLESQEKGRYIMAAHDMDPNTPLLSEKASLQCRLLSIQQKRRCFQL